MDLNEAEKLAVELMEKHGLSDWTYRHDYTRARGGVCWYREKRISLSIFYIAFGTAEQVQDTILHEIAHAMVGSAFGHGPVWKAAALAIGCSSKRYHDVDMSRARRKK